MPDCSTVCAKIIEDYLFTCNDVIVTGIEQQILFLNRCDIESYTVDTSDVGGVCQNRATAINLRSGTTGYLVTGVQGKQLFSAGETSNINDDSPNDFTHTINLRLYNSTEKNLALHRKLAQGADMVAITLDKTLSTDENKYKVYGLQNGLKLSEGTRLTSENKGATSIVLASTAPDFESTPALVWLEADIATTDAKYDSKLAVP